VLPALLCAAEPRDIGPFFGDFAIDTISTSRRMLRRIVVGGDLGLSTPLLPLGPYVAQSWSDVRSKWIWRWCFSIGIQFSVHSNLSLYFHFNWIQSLSQRRTATIQRDYRSVESAKNKERCCCDLTHDKQICLRPHRDPDFDVLYPSLVSSYSVLSPDLLWVLQLRSRTKWAA
jgi:hypothetical protein